MFHKKLKKFVAGVLFKMPCAGGRAEQFARIAMRDRLHYKEYAKKEFYIFIHK